MTAISYSETQVDNSKPATLRDSENHEVNSGSVYVQLLLVWSFLLFKNC